MPFDSGGGVTDHGNLTGLADDDHSQYVQGDRDPLAIPNSATDNTGSGTTWVAVGQNATANDGRNETVIGDGADGGQNATTVGAGSTNRFDGTVVGASIANGGNGNVLVGENTTTNGFNNRTVVVGKDASVAADDAVAIGESTSVATASTARIKGDQLVFGAVDTGQIADADLNNSEITFDLDETNSNVVVRIKNSAGTVKTGTISVT